ncbi:MAG: [FeFe] hydrogenase H-cluster radical SAM maturase HydG, partial [Alphaproteobacteria bacterium]
MSELKSFIDEEEIERALSHRADKAEILDIIAKCNDPEYTGLTLTEVAALLNNEDKELEALIFDTAKRVKQHIYGKRMVLFAPLYVSNTCV